MNPRSRHWQIAPAGSLKDTVEDAADIEQCLLNILATRKGEDVCRPTFGSGHHDYTDAPEDVLVPNFVREIFEGAAPHLFVSLHWRVADDVAGEIYRTPFKAA